MSENPNIRTFHEPLSHNEERRHLSVVENINQSNPTLAEKALSIRNENAAYKEARACYSVDRAVYKATNTFLRIRKLESLWPTSLWMAFLKKSNQRGANKLH